VVSPCRKWYALIKTPCYYLIDDYSDLIGVKGILTINISIQEATGYPVLALEPVAYVRTAVGGVDNLTLNLGGFGEEDCDQDEEDKNKQSKSSRSAATSASARFR
jgi:hypothetical protein